MKDISVVVGFKDWGLERLVISLRSIQLSFGELDGEVIVSDYGSVDRDHNRRIVEAAGATYIYTETDGKWSRSRALNAGFEVAQGEILVCTDADMLFSPSSMRSIYEHVSSDPFTYALLQCRDLPKERSHEYFEQVLDGIDWADLENKSRIRPRWGMGGMIAVTREAFIRVRGLDERMHTYGGEDIDFAQRLQRAGYRQYWIEDPQVRMYHMWHESSRKKADSNAEDKKAIAFNKEIVEKDKSHIRNLRNWEFRATSDPLVSVVISTYNRAEYLKDSINSILAQSFQDFEIIIVDDGSSDNTHEVVSSFNDPRIRYFFQENSGISRARNYAAEVSRGFYTAVHDDDDLMLPRRLEMSLSAMRRGVRATFGSWVNFNDNDGQLAIHVSKKNFAPETSFLTGQAPGHSTWLIETQIIRDFKYDESLSSAIDNNLAIRTMRAGIKWVHTGRVLFIRRMHDLQVTETDGDNQKTAAFLTKLMMQVPASVADRRALHSQASKEPWPRVPEKDNLEESIVKYLPDHLVNRSIKISGNVEELSVLLGKVSDIDYLVVEKDADSNSVYQEVQLRNVSWDDLVVLRKENISYELTGSRKTPGDSSPSPNNVGNSINSAITRSISRFISDNKSEDSTALIVDARTFEVMKSTIRGYLRYRKVLIATDNSIRREFVILAFSNYGEAFDISHKLQAQGFYDTSLVIDNKNVLAKLENELLVLDSEDSL